MDTCIGCCDITEIVLKIKLNTIKSINHSIEKQMHLDLDFIFYFSLCVSLFIFTFQLKKKKKRQD